MTPPGPARALQRNGGSIDRTPGRVRVLVIDGLGAGRENFHLHLMTDPFLDVTVHVADGLEVVRRCELDRPEVVVIDIAMPYQRIVHTAMRVIAASPAVSVIALSTHAQWPYVRELMRAGVAGYVLRSNGGEALQRAIRVVASGGMFLDPGLFSGVMHAPPRRVAALSSRETDVGALAATGLTNAEIAGALHISVKTVETHKRHLMKKLGLATRAALVRYALGCGWLTAAPCEVVESPDQPGPRRY